MWIDLRSDTVTQPTAEMRKAIAEAEVGDDVHHEDPSVLYLEEKTAAILGKEEAVFMPSGTMTNQVGLRTHTQPGDEVILEAQAHIYYYEGGGPAALSGASCRLIPGDHGVFTADQLVKSLRKPDVTIQSHGWSALRTLTIEGVDESIRWRKFVKLVPFAESMTLPCTWTVLDSGTPALRWANRKQNWYPTSTASASAFPKAWEHRSVQLWQVAKPSFNERVTSEKCLEEECDRQASSRLGLCMPWKIIGSDSQKITLTHACWQRAEPGGRN